MRSASERALLGLLAGAAGTLALEVVTYADIAVRGRPASDVPARAAGRLAESAGLELGAGEAAQARRSGLGALLGYTSGLGAGLVYGLFRPRLSGVPGPVAGIAAGLSVMAVTDSTSTATGATDPRSWGVPGWASDLVPHLVYGVVLAGVFDQLADCR